MRLFIIIFLTSFLYHNVYSQIDSTRSKVRIDPWYTPTEDGTGYTIGVPKLEEVLEFFQKVDVTKLSDNDRMKIGYYTEQFVYYFFPKGDKAKELKIQTLIDLIIDHDLLHIEYPEIFIEFFHRNFKYFNEEQRQRISSALVRPIGLNFEDNYHAINLYQIKEFAPQIKSLLNDSVVYELKKSFLKKRNLFKHSRNFKRISILANLDTNYQDTLLVLIKYYYDFINNPENKLSQNIKTDLRIHLYGVVLKESIKNLSNRKEIISQTLYLLNEDYVLHPHGDQPGLDCAYNYYRYMIIPLLAKNRLAMDEFLKTGGDSGAYFRDLFESHRTPELMRTALIEFGILDK